jgi:hypothetical protein
MSSFITTDKTITSANSKTNELCKIQICSWALHSRHEHEKVELTVRASLTPAINEGKWPASRSDRFTRKVTSLDIHYAGDWSSQMVWKRFTRMKMKERGRSLKYSSLYRTFIPFEYKTMEVKIISAKRLQRQRRQFIWRHGFLILLTATKP